MKKVQDGSWRIQVHMWDDGPERVDPDRQVSLRGDHDLDPDAHLAGLHRRALVLAAGCRARTRGRERQREEGCRGEEVSPPDVSPHGPRAPARARFTL